MDTNTDDDTIKCPMCDTVIEDICVLPIGMIARFYKWTENIRTVDGIIVQLYYCPVHSKEEIKDFEEKNNIKP